MTTTVRVPRHGANENEAQVIEIYVTEGEWVDVNQAICVLETTKATFDVASESSGYVRGLSARVGDIVRVGAPLCDLADSEISEAASVGEETSDSDPGTVPVQAEVRISKAALDLARRNGVDLGGLPKDRIITSEFVRNLVEPEARDAGARAGGNPARDLVLFGGGRHASMLIDLLAQLPCYRIIGIIDDHLSAGLIIAGIPVLGDSKKLEALRKTGVCLAVNGIGSTRDIRVRMRASERLRESGFLLPSVIHPRSIVEPSAHLEDGVQVFAGAYVGSHARIGHDAIVSAGAIVSHHCDLGSDSTISPGAILAGEVTIGDRCLIGMGVTINAEVSVGADCQIGNGGVLHFDVPAQTIVQTPTTWPKA